LSDEPVFGFLDDRGIDFDKAAGIRKEAKGVRGEGEIGRILSSPVRESAVGDLIPEEAFVARLQEFLGFSFGGFRDPS
jgi:hypothetical protein